MVTRRVLWTAGVSGLVVAATSPWWTTESPAVPTETFAVAHTDTEWRKLLTPAQYDVLRQSGTERPFSSLLLHEERHGDFACAGCDLDAFSWTTKFDSHTGWPSFWAPIDKVVGDHTRRDVRHGANRRALQPLRRPSRPCFR